MGMDVSRIVLISIVYYDTTTIKSFSIMESFLSQDEDLREQMYANIAQLPNLENVSLYFYMFRLIFPVQKWMSKNLQYF